MKFILLITIFISFSPLTFGADTCNLILLDSSNVVLSSNVILRPNGEAWNSTENLIAFEILAAAMLSKEIYSGSRLFGRSPLQNIVADSRGLYRDANPEGLLDEITAKERKKAVKFVKKNIHIILSQKRRIREPFVNRMFGKVFIDRLSHSYRLNRSEVNSFIDDNIDAILLNAVLSPKLSIASRLGIGAKLGGKVGLITMGVAGLFTVGGGALVSLVGYFLNDDFLTLSDWAKYGGNMAFYSIGMIPVAGFVAGTPLATIGGYIAARNLSDHDLATYDHDIGRAVRAEYETR